MYLTLKLAFHINIYLKPATIPVFLRSLSATMSRKFPIKSVGDPFASPSSMPYIHSIISLLTLSAPVSHLNAPLEHISLRGTYLPYLTAAHITPLEVIQALLPLLRTGSARSRDIGNKSIIVCLPATDVRVGLPFGSVQAMSAAATLRGVEVLRREIRISAMTERTDSMQNINIVVVDVGTFDVGSPLKALPPEGIYKSMEDWSASEKVVYGPAFIAVMHEKPLPTSLLERIRSIFKGGDHYGVPRKGTSLSVLTDNLVGVVSGGRYGPTLFGISLGIGRIRHWMRGERLSIGAGGMPNSPNRFQSRIYSFSLASTYRLASHLPSFLLDGLINLPHFLISIRNRLLPVQPFREPPVDLPPPVTERKPATTELKEQLQTPSESETNSDADVESNAGDMVDSSWVSLHQKVTGAEA